MQLSHQFTVPASVDVAWDAFNDLERIAPCFPGAALTSYDGDTFEGICKVKLGPVSLQYAGSGRFLERDESAHRAVIEARGKDKRGNGTANATITAQLTPEGDSSTGVVVSTDLSITGRPAQFGRGVMQDVSDRLLAQFATCLETKLVGDTDDSGAVDGGARARIDGPAVAPEGPQPSLVTGFVEQPVAQSASTPTTPAPPAHKATGMAPELNLAATVLPAVLKRYAPYLAGGVAGLWLVRATARRFSASRSKVHVTLEP